MNKTKIEWCLNPDGTPGYTWNPITGCLNGCPYCYARKLANTRLKERYLANTQTTKEVHGIVSRQEFHHGLKDPFYPRFWEDRLYHPFDCKAKGIFVCDMSDLFGIGIPEEWTKTVMHLCRLHDENRYYLLTKQPQNLIKFSPFPDNCWVGQTLTAADDYVYLYNKMEHFKNIEAKVKFISFEPLLGRVDLPNIPMLLKAFYLYGVNWVIIGAQTKPYKPPKIEWVREIVDACRQAGVPYFLKNNLRKLFIAPDGEIPTLRQEVPSENNSSITSAK